MILLEIRYQSDLYGSYLLILAEDLDHDKYTFKMLEKNRIKGVLTCKERMEDGRFYLYIDITGKKNLYQEYQEKEMNLQEMTYLFQGLICILERLRDYLLTEKMVVLEPELIYKDIEDGSISILVVPWEREDRAPFRKLAEFLLEKMNHLDKNGISAAYQFYRQQSQPQFSIHQFLNILEEENILSRQKDMYVEKEKKDSIDKSAEIETEESDFDSIPLAEEDLCKKGASKVFLSCLILSFSIFILCFLPFVEKNQKISCLVLSAILLLFGIIHRFFLYRNEREDTHREEEEFKDLVEIGEETVFFGENKGKDNLKLQWKERGKKKMIEVEMLPFTIGKKKDQVSLQLLDPSVSRIHCRITEQEGALVLMDMDSTNGTYLNGIRVEKGEMLEIVKNDEILVGKVKILVV